jgi:hypothetical protein
MDMFYWNLVFKRALVVDLRVATHAFERGSTMVVVFSSLSVSLSRVTPIDPPKSIVKAIL